MSHKTLKSAVYSANQLLKKTRGLSFKTIADYKKEAKLMLTQLNAGGYQLFNIRHLKRRHIEYLLKQWKEQKLSIGTIKNRMSKIRFICKLIGKRDIVPRDNHEFGLGARTVSKVSRAIHNIDLSKIKNDYIRYSIRLQQEFGLRREESIKFIPSQADECAHIRLKPSWTKGGIGRIVPIRKESQRKLLDELKNFVKRGKSLIPDGSTYRRQENVYVSQARQAGLKNLHGLRHAYAQKRYFEITALMSGGDGWNCPANGGIPSEKLLVKQKEIDRLARESIAIELGHSRISVSRVYLD